MAEVCFVPRPTAVQPADRLALGIGLEPGRLWLKRDDLVGLGGGGNKARKLEVTMAEALEQGASAVVTTGAPQSNHARLTAAAGAALGLDVVLVLWGDDPGTRRGNLLLDELFGAEVVWARDRDVEALADEVAADRGAYRIPYGGSNAASAMSYAEAGREILAQVPDVLHVVVAVGSGGTMAGLVTALGPDRVLGVDTGAVDDPRAAVSALLADTPGAVVEPSALRVDGGQVGPGYAHLTDDVKAAMLLAARAEGVVLDPTYTGRAMAGLWAAARSGEIAPEETVVFVHTGGLPGLFGHPQL